MDFKLSPETEDFRKRLHAFVEELADQHEDHDHEALVRFARAVHEEAWKRARIASTLHTAHFSQTPQQIADAVLTHFA